MSQIEADFRYREALVRADLVLLDSGYLALLWRMRHRRRISRISGLRFLRALLSDPRFAKSRRFWVMPCESEGAIIRDWLETHGLPTPREDCLTAPHYPANEIADPELLERIAALRPDVVILNIGGGVQEVLGDWLRQNLPYRPAILCTGAAIAFLAGTQTTIPVWVDRAHLGWCWRIAGNPARYRRRYLRSLRLAELFWKHGAALPNPALSRTSKKD